MKTRERQDGYTTMSHLRVKQLKAQSLETHLMRAFFDVHHFLNVLNWNSGHILQITPLTEQTERTLINLYLFFYFPI